MTKRKRSMKEENHASHSRKGVQLCVCYQQTWWDTAVLKYAKGGVGTKPMKGSENGRTRKTHATINPHLPKILVCPLTLTSTHHLIDCTRDQYLSLHCLQRQPAMWLELVRWGCIYRFILGKTMHS